MACKFFLSLSFAWDTKAKQVVSIPPPGESRVILCGPKGEVELQGHGQKQERGPPPSFLLLFWWAWQRLCVGERTLGAWSIGLAHAALRGVVGLRKWDYCLSSQGVKNGRNWRWVRDSREGQGKWKQTGLDDVIQISDDQTQIPLGGITMFFR